MYFLLSTESHFSKGVKLNVQEKECKCFVLDMRFANNGSLTAVVTTTSGDTFNIHYVFSDLYVDFDGKSNIYYGLGNHRTDWINLARDLKIDLLKGLLVRWKLPKVKVDYAYGQFNELQLHGQGWVGKVTVAKTIHMEQFYNGADWLLNNQDKKGGWPVNVARTLTGFPTLQPGWYSAMGQGQAMSTLVRAYLDSGKQKYLDAAIRALQVYQIDSKDGGVRARFFDKYDWYEEYPTIPSSFVLNGFIYSLIGVYDAKEASTGEDKALAEKIYNSGMTSLKHMINMYDSGIGTLYDLRHVTTGYEPNRARWDYHTTHINQILQLIVFDDADVFKTTVKRWIGYMKGIRSRHN